MSTIAQPVSKEYLSVSEIPGAGYPMTASFLRKLIRERKIAVHRIGRNVRIARIDLDAFMDACRRPAQTREAA